MHPQPCPPPPPADPLAQWLADLVRRAAAGDRAAFEALVQHFQRPLFSFLGRMGLRQSEAEELAQDSFVRAWQHLPEYDATRAAFSTWLFTIARRLALNAWLAEPGLGVPEHFSARVMAALPSAAGAPGARGAVQRVRPAAPSAWRWVQAAVLKVRVNGQAVPAPAGAMLPALPAPSAVREPAPPAEAPARDFIVPPGQLFALGDKRDHSIDSRHFGGVPLADVVGRVRQVWFSWGEGGVRWERLGRVVQ